MAEKACKKDKGKKDPEKVQDKKYECKKCGSASNKEAKLCKPKKRKD